MLDKFDKAICFRKRMLFLKYLKLNIHVCSKYLILHLIYFSEEVNKANKDVSLYTTITGTLAKIHLRI